MYYWDKKVEMNELVGKTIKEITGLDKGSDEVRIFTECGQEYMLHHSQDCCETVDLNDFEGDSSALVGGLVVSAEEVKSESGEPKPEYPDSWTWTFYKIETNKGGLWMRWLGESNGYYSEAVDFVWVNKPDSD